ncbi:Collagen alpha-1(XXV) chain [Galemys pyrenaicus]|uniref:Collagen alpha-1(XXV) chain n=1 Tax=Galemys pyrenaicus TaxID=202257 RepID=A0A8J6AEB0_GALPY|nr:Collagen alpha-1(XXV) chain [Galemys pyrenaicus]
MSLVHVCGCRRWAKPRSVSAPRLRLRQLVVQPPGLNFGGAVPSSFPWRFLEAVSVTGGASDPAAMLLKKQAGKGEAREPRSEDPGPAGPRCARSGPPCAALAALLSVVAVTSCLYLGVKTSDLQARIAALESSKGGPSVRVLPDSLDQLKAMVQEKVERALAQVWKAGVLCTWRAPCTGMLCTWPASPLTAYWGGRVCLRGATI